MQCNNQISAEKLKRNSFVLLKMQVFIPPINKSNAKNGKQYQK